MSRNWIGALSAAARRHDAERVLTSPKIHLEIFASASGDAPNPNTSDCGSEAATGGIFVIGHGPRLAALSAHAPMPAPH
jgi:hypothetical protein